ncbi:MAG: REP-associated tyrosine transposase [Candidatus Acidiferrales bacterium]
MKAGHPRRKRIRLPLQDYHSTGWYFVTICCTDKKSHFIDPSARSLVVKILRDTATSLSVELVAFTVLPNHVHFICSAGEKGLVRFVQAFKSCSALELKRRGASSSPWQRSFFDHKIRSTESLKRKCEYIWLNPVRKGLVRRMEDYPWSGALLTG